MSLPDGSQKWPDLLFIYNNMGLSIESKASRQKHVVWNGGMTEQDAIYLSWHGKAGICSAYLGQDIFTIEDRDYLKFASNKVNEFVKTLSDEWDQPVSTYLSYYPRHMNNNRKDLTKKPERTQRLNSLFAYIKSLTWDKNQKTYFSH